MAAVNSTMLPLGTSMPSFRLPNAIDGKLVDQHAARGSASLVMFICNHCPYVIHIRPELTKLVQEYQAKGLAVVAINANSLATHPQDGPEAMKALALKEGWTFPFLFDATQATAKAFRAACTPDFFLFDRDARLIYRGQFDETRPNGGKAPTGRDLRVAIDAVLAGRVVSEDQRPSIGCNIKWTPGNEPAWFG